MQSQKSHPAETAFFAIGLALLLVLAITAQTAQAQTFKVLHTFKGASNDGAAPWGVLVRDGVGNLYGTTTSGGSGREFCTNYGGCGTAFKFDKSGKKIWLHSFTFPKDWSPETGLLRDASGMLYGTTYGGGDTSCASTGCGTVFGLSTTGRETVRYKFKGSPDGQFPTEQPLVEDLSGNFYGTIRGHASGAQRRDHRGRSASGWWLLQFLNAYRLHHVTEICHFGRVCARYFEQLESARRLLKFHFDSFGFCNHH